MGTSTDHHPYSYKYTPTPLSLSSNTQAHKYFATIMNCIVLGARKLTIYHSDNPLYWKWERDPSSGDEVVELLKVWWFDVRGLVKASELSEGASYSAFVVFNLTSNPLNLENAKVAFRYVNEVTDESPEEGYTVFIDKKRQPGEQGRFPVHRNDGWMEIEIGTFVNVNHGGRALLELRLYNLTSAAKSGFVVRAIEIRRNYG